MISYSFVSSIYTLAQLAIHLPWCIFFTLTGANMPFTFITPLPDVVSSNHSKGIIPFFEFKSRKTREHYRNTPPPPQRPKKKLSIKRESENSTVCTWKMEQNRIIINKLNKQQKQRLALLWKKQKVDLMILSTSMRECCLCKSKYHHSHRSF